MDLIDITSAMQTWFAWGMYIMIASMFYSFVVFGYQTTKIDSLAKAANIISCIQGLVLIVWVIFGSVLRFSIEGKSCSGKYYVGDT